MREWLPKTKGGYVIAFFLGCIFKAGGTGVVLSFLTETNVNLIVVAVERNLLRLCSFTVVILGLIVYVWAFAPVKTTPPGETVAVKQSQAGRRDYIDG